MEHLHRKVGGDGMVQHGINFKIITMKNIFFALLFITSTSLGQSFSSRVLSAVSGTYAPLASPTLVTPNIGIATATSVNKITITAPATGATLTIPDGVTLNAGTGGTLGSNAFTSTSYQPLDGDLATIAGLTATTDNFMVGTASAWASRTPAQAKTSLSLNNVENTAISTWAGSSNVLTVGTIGTGTWQGTVVGSTYGGTGINNAGRTLTISTNSGTVAFTGSGTTQSFPPATSTVVGRVASANIASTASATSTTTLYTPPADGFYRVNIYLKITTTGTSPVAGPVTITYTDALGSVAQSHVMLLANTSGAVVTTTVNNSTTTGTVYGSMVMYAKASVAIQYAIAVSGTFGSGRYQAFLTCEAL